MRYQRISLALAVAAAAALAPTAPQAIEMQAGAWKFTLDGNVNADYIHSSCEDTPAAIAGGLACTIELELPEAADSGAAGRS